MDKKLFGIARTRVQNFRYELRCRSYRNPSPMKAVPFAELDRKAFVPVERGQLWGHAWENAWFHLTGTVSASPRGKELLTDKKGIPHLLGSGFKKGKKFEFYAEAVSMPIMGPECGFLEIWNLERKMDTVLPFITVFGENAYRSAMPPRRLNRVPYLANGFSAGKAAAPVTLESDGVTLEVVKKAEKENLKHTTLY